MKVMVQRERREAPLTLPSLCFMLSLPPLIYWGNFVSYSCRTNFSGCGSEQDFSPPMQRRLQDVIYRGSLHARFVRKYPSAHIKARHQAGSSIPNYSRWRLVRPS